MTFLVKCDGCGNIQEADDQGHFPGNPENPGTGQKWYSRVPLETKKTVHACCRGCIKDGGMVFPL